MNLTLTLTPETEARLKEQAARAGKAPESVAREALEEKLAIEEPPPQMLPPDEWRARFHALLASLPRTTATFVDDGRESIYEGRGE